MLDSENVFARKSQTVISSALTLEYLKQLEFDWPEVDDKYLLKLFEYMKDVGFI